MMNGYIYGVNDMIDAPYVASGSQQAPNKNSAGELASAMFLKMIIGQIIKNNQEEGIFGKSFQSGVVSDAFTQNIAQQLAKDDIFGFNKVMPKDAAQSESEQGALNEE
jgi:hypothetical protein